MGKTATTIIFVVILVGMLVLAFFLQGWRARRSPLGKVLRIFKDMQYDGKLIESFPSGAPARRFRTAAWARYKKAVSFLPEELWVELDRIFGDIDEINARIDAALKLGSGGYVGEADAGQLRAPLAAAAEKLRQWIYDNMNNPEYLPKKWGFFRW
jgi:hypothetical protein